MKQDLFIYCLPSCKSCSSCQKIMATSKPKVPRPSLSVETLKHDDAKRKNIPTAEYQSVMAKDEQKPVRVEYERHHRNRDLDPQLVWRGKDEQDWSNLIVHKTATSFLLCYVDKRIVALI